MEVSALWLALALLPVGQMSALQLDVPERDDVFDLRVVAEGSAGRPLLLPSPQSLVLVEKGSGERRCAMRDFNRRHEYVFEGVPRSTYVILIEDPSWSSRASPEITGDEGVVRLDLVGTSTLTLSLRSASDGVRIDAEPDVRGTSVHVSSVRKGEAVRVAESGEGRLKPDSSSIGSLNFTHLQAGTYELQVACPGYETKEVTIASLQPGESREVRVELNPVMPIVGRVLYSNGDAASGVIVALYRHALTQDGEGSPFWSTDGGELFFPFSQYREEVLRTVTDQEGRFRIDARPPGEYIMRAYVSPWVYTAASTPECTEARGKLNIVLRLPESQLMLGDIAMMEGSNECNDLLIWARHAGEGMPGPWSRVEISRDARFAIVVPCGGQVQFGCTSCVDGSPIVSMDDISEQTRVAMFASVLSQCAPSGEGVIHVAAAPCR